MSDYLVDLEDGEYVIEEVRKNLLVFSMRVLSIVLLFVLPIPFLPAIADTLAETVEASGTIVTIAYLVWALALWVLFFLRWTDYYLDVWVITNHRIFDIEQNGLFSRNISVFRLDRIEDVTVEVHGIIATLFKFGDVHIHTAGSHAMGHPADLTIKSARRPLEVKRTIMNAYSAALKGEHAARPRHQNSTPIANEGE